MTSQKRPMIRILIADDHPMMLTGIKTILNSRKHLQIVGDATNGEEAISRTKALAPDIVLMDISMPVMNGLEATAVLRKEAPEVRVILLTMHDDKEYVAQFVKSGAHGYIVKTGPPDEILSAIEAVHRGGAFFSPSISQAILSVQQSGNESASLLTEREEQVLKFIAKGHSSKQIAALMNLSLRTIAKHRETIHQKLNLHSVAELTSYAFSRRLVETDPS